MQPPYSPARVFLGSPAARSTPRPAKPTPATTRLPRTLNTARIYTSTVPSAAAPHERQSRGPESVSPGCETAGRLVDGDVGLLVFEEAWVGESSAGYAGLFEIVPGDADDGMYCSIIMLVVVVLKQVSARPRRGGAPSAVRPKHNQAVGPLRANPRLRKAEASSCEPSARPTP
jgi:hypothetical protein